MWRRGGCPARRRGSLAFVSWLVLCSSSCSGEDPLAVVALGGSPILLTSARGGNYDIYMMDADGSGPRRLTTDAAVDQSADWSPDRSSFVFMSNRAGGGDSGYDVWASIVTRRWVRQLTNSTHSGFPRWSPDGTRILFSSSRDGNHELYVMDADGTNPTRLTWNPGEDLGGAWSPDGSRIVFASERGGRREIHVMRADGTGIVQLTHNTVYEGNRVAWSLDDRIVFHAYPDPYAYGDGDADIYVIDADGSEETRITHDPARDRFPLWSCDGRRIGFTSDRDGDDEIYVMNADGTEPVRLTHSAGLDVLDAWAC